MSTPQSGRNHKQRALQVVPSTGRACKDNRCKDKGLMLTVQILQYPDDHTAEVLFCDFGGQASVPLEMLRQIM